MTELLTKSVLRSRGICNRVVSSGNMVSAHRELHQECLYDGFKPPGKALKAIGQQKVATKQKSAPRGALYHS
jgi:hypothetical protein